MLCEMGCSKSRSGTVLTFSGSMCPPIASEVRSGNVWSKQYMFQKQQSRKFLLKSLSL